MGPTRGRDQRLTQEEAFALLREKDDQIATLEAKLEAFTARASTAQTRLLKTIDVLDALRTQHALELSTEENAKVKLAHEMDQWCTLAKSLEVEKDELKDVVEDLIEKVQISNEWSSWPCSRMHITKHADQVAENAFDLRKMDHNYHDDLLAYATSIIARLRVELDFERQSHSRTIEEANLRIEELEAKVAVREAELEDRIATLQGGPGKEGPDNPTNNDLAKRRAERRIPQPKVMSDDECLRFLESNSARNRFLELEIRGLAERLEQVRMAASTSSEPHKSFQSPTPQNDQIGTIVCTSRTRSASVDPGVLSRSSNPERPEDRNPQMSPPSTALSIAQLDSQIRAMTAHMDALRIERIALVESAARQRRATNGINTDNFQDVLRLEGECVRLQSEADDLREQLDLSRSSARSREKTLLREIAHLRALPPGSTHPAHDLYVFSPRLLENGIIPEESMELATPLEPTIIPGPPPHVMPDANLSSLSFVPDHASSPPLDAPFTPPLPHSSPGSNEFHRVQAALNAARAHLAEKETELALLHAQMEKGQRQVETKEEWDKDKG